MKVIVHHLPTGCKWEVESDRDMCKFVEECFTATKGFVVGDNKGCTYFPADVVAQSVVKVIA